MSIRRLTAISSIAVLAFAACSGGGGSSAAPSAAESAAASAAPSAAESAAASSGSEGGCTVGMSWNNYQEERWAKWDEPAIKAAIEAGGGTYIANDAKSSAETQATNVENLISQGANVVIILAEDDVAIKPSVTSAIGEGIPVIAYDRLIEDPGVLYITFDNIEVGRMQAREIFERVPSGNYAIIKGNEADANARFLRDGYEEIIGAAVTAGDITIVGETFTDGWKPDVAQTNMEQILTSANNDVDAVLSENDGMAGGVVAALEAQGLAGKVPVSGQDGDQAALNRVALGTQTLSVWKDARELGTAAGEAAIALCANPDVSAVAGTEPFTTPGGNSVASQLLEPLPILQDNLNVVVDAGWIAKDALCQGVTDTTAVPACQ
jgi:D-xylose transport system substrate-binding protein